MTSIRALAEFLAAAPAARLSASTLTAAKSCLLDWAAAALAAAPRTDLAAALRSAVEDADCAPRATVVGTPVRTSPALAAFSNAARAHALDFDDVLVAAPGLPIHPSATVAAAALAVAEANRASGIETLAAVVLGIEAEARIARALGARHYEAGWHATSTVGAVGASVAAARLYGLDGDAMFGAMGLAATQSSGLRAGFGTHAKPLQVAFATMNGLVAAGLARDGAARSVDLFSQPHGFLGVFGPPERPEALDEDLGRRFAVESVTFKRYPSCGATHAAVDAVLEMKDRPVPEDVESVVVSVPRSSASTAPFVDPADALQAKFSIHHCTALALATGGAGLAQFEDGIVLREDVVALRRRISVKVDERAPGASLEIRLRSGGTLVASPDRNARLQSVLRRHECVDSKFIEAAGEVLSPDVAREALRTIRTLDSLADVSAAVAGLAARATASEPVR